MPTSLRILIIGGGIAGMSAAIRMAMSGHDVELVDIDSEWRAYGAGITVQGAMFRVLRTLELADQVAAAGFPCRGTRARLADGTFLDEVLATQLEPDLPNAGGIMRPVLHAILSARVRELGVKVRLGVSFAQIDDGLHEARVVFTDGVTGGYDLIIGADGIYSKMRDLLFPNAPRPQFNGQGVFRTVAPRPAELDMVEIFLGGAARAGVTPVSRDELYMFTLSAERGEDYLTFEQQVRRLREVLAGFGGLVGEIRDTLGPDSQITYRPLQSLLLPKPWHRGRIVLIGDAAHASTPQLAAGAMAAGEDAVLLDRYVSVSDDLGQALVEFTERRFDRCKFIVERALLLGRIDIDKGPGDEQTRLYDEAIARISEPA